MRIRRSVDFISEAELAAIETQAEKAGLSLSNFIRKRLKLPLMKKGGAQPNTGRRYCVTCKEKGLRTLATHGSLCKQCEGQYLKNNSLISK